MYRQDRRVGRRQGGYGRAGAWESVQLVKVSREEGREGDKHTRGKGGTVRVRVRVGSLVLKEERKVL